MILGLMVKLSKLAANAQPFAAIPLSTISK